MKFGPVPPQQAAGAVLAHSISVGGVRLRKGSVLTAEDCARIEAAGLADVVVARLEADDIGEDEAARLLAEALAGSGLRVGRATTGRCNLYAEADGLLTFDAQAVHRLNGVDEAITLATLPPESRVQAGDAVATIKIIPYAAPLAAVDAAKHAAASVNLRLARFRPMSIALLQTRLAGQKEELFAKTERVTQARLARLGLKVNRAEVLPHDTALLAERLAAATEDLILIVGASAIADRRDVIPAAVTAAGGEVERLGMPVDPGNLLCLARLGGSMGSRPVIGLPGCARSPKRNGLDMVLERLAAGLPVNSAAIARMGVGGLIDEIPERPAPRLNADAPENKRGPIGAIILAAGQSRRMGPRNKLLIEVNGQPLLTHVVRAVHAAGLPPPLVVTGCEAEQVRAALAGLPVRFAHNPHFAEGLSTSLRAGLDAAPESWAGALICLGDMPEVTPETLKALTAAFNPANNASICAPTHNGKRGNPVLWGRQHFARLKALSGDVGAKHLLAELGDQVAEVETPSPGVLTDVDTPEALEALMAGQSG